MLDIEMIVLLLGIIAIAGIVFDKSELPLSLFLVIIGIILSPILDYPLIEMHPEVVIYVFLPLLIYGISTQFSIKDFKKNLRPILLLSIGHVFFITALIAFMLHWLVPQISWPLAFVIGAVISPPDDVAIASIAEKIKLPARVVNILEGEGMLNDAAALILLRFALIALITHHFSPVVAAFQFGSILIGETLYGIVIGHILGKIRTHIKNPILHITVSLLTPFIAYLPAEKLGGCGVISTVIVGFIIGNFYSVKFNHQFRILSRSVWPTISFVIQSFLFLMVGINIEAIYQAISVISINEIIKLSSIVIGTVIVGRFIWVYPATYLPRFLFRSIRKKDPYPPWQYPFIVSWAGMRGGISLAAALIVPSLPVFVDDVNARDLVTFLAFVVILATLVLQGLSLPWIIKKIGLTHHTEDEKHQEITTEISARLSMTEAALQWLQNYSEAITADKILSKEIKLHIKRYESLKNNLNQKFQHHSIMDPMEVILLTEEINLCNQIIEAEKEMLLQLWQQEKISLQLRNKLLQELDYRTQLSIEE